MVEFQPYAVAHRLVQSSLPPVIKDHIVSLPLKTFRFYPQAVVRAEYGYLSACSAIHFECICGSYNGRMVCNHP